MKPAAFTAIVIVLVLVAIYMASSGANSKEGFLEAMAYNPCFIDPLGPSRNMCKGYTSGYMPSIETESAGGWMCAGLLGVPP